MKTKTKIQKQKAKHENKVKFNASKRKKKKKEVKKKKKTLNKGKGRWVIFRQTHFFSTFLSSFLPKLGRKFFPLKCGPREKTPPTPLSNQTYHKRWIATPQFKE